MRLRRPLWWLVGGSLLAALLSGAASYVLFRREQWPWLQDALLNLAFTFGSVLLTVAVVDRLLRRHEEQEWSAVTDVIGHYLDRPAHAVLRTYAERFDLTPAFRERIRRAGGDEVALRAEAIDAATEILLPHADRVARLSGRDWQTLLAELKDAHSEASRAMELFGARMSPATMGALLNLQRCIDHVESTILLPWQEDPKLVAAPPDTRQQVWLTLAHSEARAAIEAAATLLRVIGSPRRTPSPPSLVKAPVEDSGRRPDRADTNSRSARGNWDGSVR